MNKRRLFLRLYPTYLAVAVLSMAGVAGYASYRMRTFHYRDVEQELLAAANILVEQIKAADLAVDGPDMDVLCKTLGRVSSYRITIILPSGVVTGDALTDAATMDNHGDRPEIQAALQAGKGVGRRFSSTIQTEMMYVAVPVADEDSIKAVVRVAMPLDRIDGVLHAMWVRIAYGTLAIAIIGAAMSWLVSFRITAPIARIKRGALAFGEGDFTHRLPSSPILEIDVLASTMNDMADQLNERIHTVMRQRDEQDSLLGCMIESVIAVDSDKHIIKMNDSASTLFHVGAKESVGHSIVETVRNADLIAIIDETLADGGPTEAEILHPDGDRHLHVHGTALHDISGAQVGVLLVVNDVTRIRKLEIMRRDFVANVSHELKTPVTSIKGFADTLLDGEEHRPEDVKRFLGIIGRQASRLESILEDLLSLSRIEHEAENGEINMRDAQLRRVLENAVQTCQAAASAKDIALQMSCDEALQSEVNVPLLERAVINLIDNAVKYSEARTSVEVAAAADDGGIAIRVTDRGVGIPERHQQRLFERFYRVDRGRSRELGGTGLGLAIVKQVALAHGGRVTVDSEVGKGSTFTIRIPGRGVYIETDPHA